MKINIFLPGFPKKAMGGYKIIYQYANYLSENGADVYIYYGCYDANKRNNSLMVYIKNFIKKMIINNYPKWFDLDRRIKQKCIVKINNYNVRNADISIATFILTSFPVSKLNSCKGKKLYFIQDYENWLSISEEEVLKSYNLDLKKIVISKWLKKIVDSNSNDESMLIRNGIDTKKFKIINPIDKRNKFSIAMLYHIDERKGTKYGLEAIKILHDKYPSMSFNLFGSFERNTEIPEWVNYTSNASEKEVIKILNDSAVYICTSINEGFGLPGLECMACGCALITTETLGSREYANENNSIIIKSKNINQIVNAVEKLVNDDKYRISIAKQGNKDVKSFDLNLSCKKFYEFLIKK